MALPSSWALCEACHDEVLREDLDPEGKCRSCTAARPPLKRECAYCGTPADEKYCSRRCAQADREGDLEKAHP